VYRQSVSLLGASTLVAAVLTTIIAVKLATCQVHPVQSEAVDA
jgi:hypothetical protein